MSRSDARTLCWVLVLLLPGCKGKVPREVALGTCQPLTAAADSATIAACLTGQFEWSADSAGRAAHTIAESLVVVRQRAHDESLAAAQAASVLSDVNDAADKAKNAPPAKTDIGLGMIWVGSRKTRTYYRGNCAAAKLVHGPDREEFTNDRMAESAGYKRSTLPEDEPCYKALSL